MEGGGRRIETVQAPVVAVTEEPRPEKEGGETSGAGRPLETEKIEETGRAEIGRLAPTGDPAVKEIEGSVRQVADETLDRNGLT